MALIFANGFEGIGIEDLNKHYTVEDPLNYLRIAQGRNGGNALSLLAVNSNLNVTKGIGDTTANKEWFFGCAFYTGMGTAGPNFTLSFSQDSVNNPSLKIDYYTSTNNLVVSSQKSSSSYTVDGSTMLVPNTWYYIEVNFIFSKTNTGKLVVRINGVVLVNNSNVNISGNVNTNMSLNDFNFFLGGNSILTPLKVDDVYLCDTSGSYNNSFLGDIRIDMINPSSAGNYSQLSPTSGDNYTCVDEEDFSNTDYVQGSNPGDKDSYNYEDVPTDLDDANINAVVVNSLAKRTAGVDTVKIKNLVRKSSVDYKDATAKSLPDTEFVIPSVFERDPSDNSAWTKAKINACEFGVEIN